MTVTKQYRVSGTADDRWGDTIRSRHSAASAGVSTTSSNIRIFCPCGGGALKIDELWVGIATSGGNTMDMQDKVQVTFSGSTSINQDGTCVNGGVWSDTVPLSVSSSDDIIISAFIEEFAPPTLVASTDDVLLSVEESSTNTAANDVFSGTSIANYDGAMGFELDSVLYASCAGWNPNDKDSKITLSDSGHKATSNASGDGAVRSEKLVVGKIYVEYKVVSFAADDFAGIGNSSASLSSSLGSSSDAWSFGGDGNFYKNGSSVAGFSSSILADDIIGVCYDSDQGDIWFSRNGVWVGDPAAGTGQLALDIASSVFLMTSLDSSGSSITMKCYSNELTYPTPSGFESGLTGTDSLVDITSNVGLGAVVEHEDNSSIGVTSDIGLSSEVSVGVDTLIPFNIGIGATVDNAVPITSTNVSLKFSSSITVNTSNIKSVPVNIGIGSGISVGTIKNYIFDVGVGVGSGVDVTVPQVYKIDNGLGLMSVVSFETTPGDIINYCIGVGSTLEASIHSTFEISSSFMISSKICSDSESFECEIQTHDDGRWS